MGFGGCSMFCNHLDGKERGSCFTLIFFMVSRVALPCGATGLSAVCDCGIS